MIVGIVVMVIVIMIMVLIVNRGSAPRAAQRQRVFDHVLGATLQDTAGREHARGGRLQLVGPPAHDDDFETMLAIEVHVHRRTYLVAEIVLQRGQLFGELTHMVIIDEGHGRKRADPILERRFPHLGAREIAQQLGPIASARLRELVDFRDEARLHGDAETHQTVFRHGGGG